MTRKPTLMLPTLLNNSAHPPLPNRAKNTRFLKASQTVLSQLLAHQLKNDFIACAARLTHPRSSNYLQAVTCCNCCAATDGGVFFTKSMRKNSSHTVPTADAVFSPE